MTALRKRDPVALVLVAGLLVRAVLIPITSGLDFSVWDKASAALLHGVNIYAHHPDYRQGPYAYFPLFAYLEMPFRWLSWHTGVPFTVLGKLPIAGADVACALLIAAELRPRGRRVAAVGAALYFLNPLVLYNSAYYGRFDSLGCALLLLALRWRGTRRAVAFGLAVAAKTFPVFVLPGLLRRESRARLLGTVTAVLVVVSLPFLGALHPFVHDLVTYDVTKASSGLSWQQLLPSAHARLIGYALLAVFAAGAIVLSRTDDLWRYTAATLVLFLLCSKLVLEQYLTWPMPWLVLLGLTATGRGSLITLGAFTAIGIVDNESWHPFGRTSAPLSVLLAVVCAWQLLVTLRPAAVRAHKPVEQDVG